MNKLDSAPALRRQAENFLDRAYVPYSSRPAAAALLLSDGAVVPGVRVENASFQLSISAVVNAVTTAVALGRTDIVAVAHSSKPDATDEAFLVASPFGPFKKAADGVYVRMNINPLPAPGAVLEPFVEIPTGEGTGDFVKAARDVSDRAFIPESRFPVGCLVGLGDDRWIPGVNVEHPNWTQILCAERNAFGTVVTYGLADRIGAVYLTCPLDDAATPCGACRQVMVELAPEAAVWMDRGNREAERARIDQLLPGFFSGDALRRSR